MRSTGTLQFQSNVSTVVARFAGQATDTLIKWLRDSILALRARRNRIYKPYVMSRESMLRSPLADEYRRASWF